MSEKKMTEAAVAAAVTKIIAEITTEFGGDGVATVAVALALCVRGRLAGSGEGDLTDDSSDFSDRVAVGIAAAKTLRESDDTGFDGPLPTDWESAKTAFDAVITGVNWGG